jgi:hypothetical protein
MYKKDHNPIRAPCGNAMTPLCATEKIQINFGTVS